jgi:hypoxanthine phosphoribosyltransferase
MGPFPFVDRAGRGSGQAEVAASEPVGSLAPVPLEIPDFQAYCGSDPPQFQNEAELECAKILDYYGIPWEYEPRTFVLETDEDGRVTEAFTPDFYLPEQDLFLEVTVMKQSLVTRKNRKLRKIREQYPHVNVKLFYKRDIERLAQRYRLDLAS